MSGRRLALVYPGDLETRTGGYRYDRQLALALEARGWSVLRVALPAGFPLPSLAELATARERLGELADGVTALIDGLALGAMPGLAEELAARLDLIGLVHHPLYLETGLPAAQATALRASEQRALAATRHVIVTSPFTAALLTRELGVPAARLTVAVPGTDPAPIARGSRDGAIRMLCVGTVTPRKGQVDLVQALCGATGPWRLEIVGSLERDRTTAAALLASIRAQGLDGRVHVLGELDDAALVAAYNRADLLVSAARFEGYGMAIAEALARGLPVIAVAGGAVATTLPPEAGLLVPPDDAGALRASLQRFLVEPGLAQRLRRGAIAARDRLPRWSATAAIVERALQAGGA